MYVRIYVNLRVQVRNFAAECAARGASDALGLIFVLSASNLEHDYLGLYAVLEASEDSGPLAARPAQPPAPSSVRQQVHALLGSSTWRGCWLCVLDDLPAPDLMETANMDWLLTEFPWADGRTIITTRAAAWTDTEAMSVAFDAMDGDGKQRQCAECGQTPPVLFKGTKCGKCKEVYYCCRLCQQKAWKTHKPLCRQIVADRRSVAEIVGLYVGSFAEEEACSWIKSKVQQWEGDAEGILELVRHLECFPLAVALAAERACSDKTATPAMYLDALRRAGSKRAKVRGTTDEYPECFPDVVKLLLDTLLQSDQAHAEDVGQALRKLALLDTEAIPLDLLGPDEKKVVLLLQEHSLVTVDDTGCAAMHAVTQLVVRDWLTPKAQRPVLVAVLVSVLAAKLGKFTVEKPATFFIGRRYARHASTLAARAREWGILPVARPGRDGGSGGVDAGLGGGGVDGGVLHNIGAMCQQVGFFFEKVNVQPREALRMYEAALDSFTAQHGDDHPNVAASYGNIGNVYQVQGEYAEALVQHQKCLEIEMRVFGCEHQDMGMSYNNIGAVFQAQGDYENALLQYQKSLEMDIRVFGCDSVEVATSYNNIGAVYEKQGDYENALLQHHKSLEIMLRVYGQKHTLVASSYHNIGVVYQEQGKDEEALEEYQKSLEIRIRVHGQKHPLVADSYNNVGIVYGKQGKDDEALDQYKKSLDIYILVYGQDHPRVATSKFNIGLFYERRNEMDMARELFLECKRIFSKMYGPGNSKTEDASNAAQRASRCVEESV